MTLIVLTVPSQDSTFHSHPIFTASTVSTLINLQDHCWIKAVQLPQKTPKSYFPHVINQLRAEIRALPWLLYLVAGPLPRRHSFSTRPIQLSVSYCGDTASVPGLFSCRSLTAETQLQYQAYPVAGPLPRRHSFSTRPIQLPVPYRGDTASVPGLSIPNPWWTKWH